MLLALHVQVSAGTTFQLWPVCRNTQVVSMLRMILEKPNTVKLVWDRQNDTQDLMGRFTIALDSELTFGIQVSILFMCCVWGMVLQMIVL